jgi:2-polyprenyl-6-methoxyphenol hydroxylase-like FAD-dependent oxidoreductase
MNHPAASPSLPATPASGPTDTDVLIVGAGPTGLTLAATLCAQGIRCTLIDAQAEGANTSRAAVVHARTLEVLEPLGVSQALVARGLQARRFTIRDRDRVLVPIAFDRLPSAYPYTLMVSQAVTESVLLQRLRELGGQVLRPRQLVGLTQDPSGATATLDDGRSLRARYVVGADGMHSTVRERAGIAFSGGSYGESFLLADVRLSGGVPSAEVVLYFCTSRPPAWRSSRRCPAACTASSRRSTLHPSTRAPPTCRRCSMRAARSASAHSCTR